MPSKKFYVTKDSAIALRSGTDSLGQGAGDNLPVGWYADWEYRSLFYFPVDFTGMSTISSATFTVFAYNRSSPVLLNQMGWEYGDGMKIKRITSAWTEGTKGADSIWYSNNAVAWANQPTVTTTNQVVDTTKISNTRPSHGKAYTFTITDIVKQWAPAASPMLGGAQTNNGIRLEMTDPTASNGGGVEFCSREDNTINGGTSYDAFIEITYTTASTVPSNTIIAPTASEVADIVNLNDLATWTGATALARPRLSWDYVANDGGAQAQWRVKIYSLAAAGTTLFDSGFVSDPSHSSSETVDIPQSIASATHMPGGITTATSSSTVPVWSSGTATYTTASNHNLDTGMVVNITGFDQEGYNVSNAVVTVTSSTTFTVPITSDPGTATAGTTGTVATIWHTGYKGLANNTDYWWTVTTRGTTGLESAESSRTAFNVLWGQTRNEYTYTTSSYSYVHTLGATPSATEVARIFGTTPTTTVAPSDWYSSLDSAITNRGANTILVVDTRVGILNNSNTTLTTQPTVTGTMTSISSITAPDDWAVNSGSHTLQLVSTSRRFGTRSAKFTVNGTSGLIQPYRLSTGDGIAVVPNTNYVFSAYVSDGDGVNGSVTLRVYPGSNTSASVTGQTALATSGVHTSFEEDSDGWRRMYVFFNSSGNDTVRPVIFCTSWTSGQSVLLDGSIVEEGTVIRSYTPGLVNSPAVIEGGGVQIDGLQGGALRLRGSNGGNRDVVELGQYGLNFGLSGSTAELYSYSSEELSVNGFLRAWRSSATDVSLAAAVTGDTTSRGAMLASGKIEWGPGTGARDTNLYRSAASVLKTDDSLFVADLRHDSQLNFVVNSATGASVIEGGLYLPPSKAVIFEGATNDANEISLVAADATVAQTITLPNATGTVALTSQIPSITGTTFDLTGDVTMTAAALTVGGANSYAVTVDDDGHNHTASTIGVLALGTDTSGNYVAGVTSANTLISVSGSGAEGAAVVLTADMSPSFTGLITGSGGAELSGTIDLNSTISATSLSFTSNITNSRDVRIFYGTGGGLSQWRVFQDSSSERYKTNIVYMDDSDAILDVRPVAYHDKTHYEEHDETSPRQYGFLAEDMAENFDGRDFTVFNEDGTPEAIQYSRLGVPLHSAMRKLRSRIDELEARLAELETDA